MPIRDTTCAECKQVFYTPATGQCPFCHSRQIRNVAPGRERVIEEALDDIERAFESDLNAGTHWQTKAALAAAALPRHGRAPRRDGERAETGDAPTEGLTMKTKWIVLTYVNAVGPFKTQTAAEQYIADRKYIPGLRLVALVKP
jgi:hypothetical protein